MKMFQKSIQSGREYTNIKYSSDMGNLGSALSNSLTNTGSLTRPNSTASFYPQTPTAVIMRPETKKPQRVVSDVPLPR